MQKSEQLDKLGEALSKAQGIILDAKKGSTNPFFKSKYADLASVWEACRRPLSNNGLSIVQSIEVKDGKRYLDTMLLHSSGQFISSSLDLSLKDESMQSIGSAITYARRYSLSAIVGICADEDDDGEAAVGRKPKTQSLDKDWDAIKRKDEAAKTDVKPDLVTEPQLKKIWAASKQMGYEEGDMKLIIRARYGKESSKDLTKKEASELIEKIEAGATITPEGEWTS